MLGDPRRPTWSAVALTARCATAAGLTALDEHPAGMRLRRRVLIQDSTRPTTPMAITAKPIGLSQWAPTSRTPLPAIPAPASAGTNRHQPAQATAPNLDRGPPTIMCSGLRFGRQVHTGDQQHDERIQRDLAEQKRPVARDDLVDLAPHPRREMVAPIHRIHRGTLLGRDLARLGCFQSNTHVVFRSRAVTIVAVKHRVDVEYPNPEGNTSLSREVSSAAANVGSPQP